MPRICDKKCKRFFANEIRVREYTSMCVCVYIRVYIVGLRGNSYDTRAVRARRLAPVA